MLRHGGVALRITEVEAYDGDNDPGSHAFGGRTRRNEVMFGPAGFLYVYFTYGMHHCANVVVGEEGSASAVLLRAGEILQGRELAEQRRGTTKDLARGPARLCQALGIGLAENGLDLRHGALTLGPPPREVSSGPRVGLRRAQDRPWRYWVTGDPHVSAYRPAKRLG